MVETAEEIAKMREEVAEELRAEEAGEPVVQTEDQVVDAPPPGDDPWAGVNPALKQAFDEMSSKVQTMATAEARLKQAESRIGAITNELHAAKKAATELKDAPSAAQIAAATESDEKWESLKKDFPEWAEAFDGRFDKKLSAKVKELRDELKEELKGGAKVENLEVRLLNIAKPNWKKTVASPEWKEWLAKQPADRAALVQSDIAEDAISLISEFEETFKAPQKTASEIAAERKQRMKTAVLPQGGKAAPVKSQADMNAAELRASIGKEIFADS